jgi:peptidoglycan/xylan/chitin deacetylase (PgdA/CDA1 family)
MRGSRAKNLTAVAVAEFPSSSAINSTFTGPKRATEAHIKFRAIAIRRRLRSLVNADSGIHNILGRILVSSGATKFHGSWDSGATATVLTYHRVCPPQDVLSLERGLVVSPQAFETQVRYVAENCSPLTFARLVDLIRAKKRFPPRTVVLTFDDGFADNYANALPILRRHGVTATVFVTTDYIGSTGLFWWDKLSSILQRAPCKTTAFRWNGQQFTVNTGSSVDTERTYSCLVQYLRDDESVDKDAFLESVRSVLTSPPAPAVKTHLDWDEVRAMDAVGIEIGSHTCSHVRMSAVNKYRLYDELARSKAVIERELGKPVLSVAYPYGREVDFNSQVIAAVEELGYTGAATTVFNVARLRSHPFMVERVSVRAGDSFATFRAKITGSYAVLYSCVERLLR